MKKFYIKLTIKVLWVSNSLIKNQTKKIKKELSLFIAHILINEVGLKKDPTAMLVGELKRVSEFPLYSKKIVDKLLYPKSPNENDDMTLSLKSKRNGRVFKVFLNDDDLENDFEKVSIECTYLENNYMSVRYLISRKEVFSCKVKNMCSGKEY
jgi:hypothetical protein